MLAQGYRDRTGPAVPYPQIYLRPAGNLHTSPREHGPLRPAAAELGRDRRTSSSSIRNISATWSTRERRSRRTRACATATAPASPARGSAGLSAARPRRRHRRLHLAVRAIRRRATSATSCCSTRRTRRRRCGASQSLAVRYLKADVEPPAKAEGHGRRRRCFGIRGLLPRRQPAQPGVRVHRVAAFRPDDLGRGRSPVRRSRSFGRARPLIPGQRTRCSAREDDVEATTRVRDTIAGTMVLAGASQYAERQSRWRVEIVRWPVMFRRRGADAARDVDPVARVSPQSARAEPSGFWWLKIALLLCAVAVALPPSA